MLFAVVMRLSCHYGVLRVFIIIRSHNKRSRLSVKLLLCCHIPMKNLSSYFLLVTTGFWSLTSCIFRVIMGLLLFLVILLPSRYDILLMFVVILLTSPNNVAVPDNSLPIYMIISMLHVYTLTIKPFF